MRSIDLNADLGEGCSHDAELIALVSSVNIACGGHAGDESTMHAAIEASLASDVAIGAHPGYEDHEHFGRRALHLAPDKIADLVSRQIERLMKIAARSDAIIHHVKPHGALYQQANQDPEMATAVVNGVARIHPRCKFYVPASGELAAAGKAAELLIRNEGFADRRYQEDGQLQPRNEDGSVIHDIGVAVAQSLEIALHHRVMTASHSFIPLHAQTLCIHGDGANAVALLQAVRSALLKHEFTILAR
ncbi:MAG: LamB/YcsF family protein [Gloeobacteraceae cyanobacterium ES-bin-144]|nr:LamB/YcsF family protein [Verrucomicrobiales bacterium]